MTCNNIYEKALALIGDMPTDAGTEYYADRAPALLSMVVREYAPITGTVVPEITSLDASFPLDDRLAPPAAMRLAALLIIDELPGTAEVLNSSAARSLQAVWGAEISSIKEVY
ncbi:MAG: hypothetical protein IJ493_11725 [Clostridia bacterium]|nr:hypothetical protein [Clostridia bacterium]